MKIWIVCTGEAEGIWPERCDGQGFEAAARRAVDTAASSLRFPPIQTHTERLPTLALLPALP